MEKKAVSAIVFVVFLIGSSVVTAGNQVEGGHFENSLAIAAREKHFTVSFPQPEVVNVGHYHRFEVANCSYLTRARQPMLPFRSLTIKLPEGSVVTDVAIEVREASLDGRFSILPAPSPSVVGVQTQADYKEDPKVYRAKEWFPRDWYVYRQTRGMDPETLTRAEYLVLSVFPLRVIPYEGRVIRAEKVSVTVTYTEPIAMPLVAEIENLIISSPSLEPYAVELGMWKNTTGISSRVLTTTWIYNEYPGVDEPEKIRNCISDFVESKGITYVTIFGDADQVPVRYAYVPDSEAGETYVPTDLYYADLDGTWDDNGDGLYADQRYDNVDGVPDVYIGRIPPSLVEYADVAVNKIIGYQQSFDASQDWTRRVVLVAGTGHNGLEDNFGVAFPFLKDYIADIVINENSVKLYESYGNLTTGSMTNQINDGCLFLNFAGHGSPDAWLLYWIIPPVWSVDFDISNVQSLTNGFKLPVVTTMSCSTARFDDHECMAEWFVLEPDGGSIAYFGATRIAYGFAEEGVTQGLMGEMDWRIYETFYEGYTRTGEMWGETMRKYVQHNIWDYQSAWMFDVKTFMEFVLLGDPTLRVYNPDYPETLNVPEEYATIQDAINAAYDGDTVMVSPGTYYEHVVVNKSVSLVGESQIDTIVDGDSTGTVVEITASNVNITGLTIQESGGSSGDCAICVSEGSTGNNISHSIMTHNWAGIRLEYTSDNAVSRNSITNNDYGIYVRDSSSNTISENTITNSNYGGILLEYSSGNSISRNTIRNNGGGIRLVDWSNNNAVHDNEIANNGAGISIFASSNTVLRGNNMTNNEYNFGITSYGPYGELSDYIHDVDVSNTVDGNPIYYLVNKQDFTVPLDAGYVALVNCSRTTVQGLNLTKNGQGVLLAFTTESTIIGNTITHNVDGIKILGWLCSNNTVSGNRIADNGRGIYSFDSTDNTIGGNTLLNNSIGIHLDDASNIDIVENDIGESNTGIWLMLSWGIHISENIIAENNCGIETGWNSGDNTISGNTIINSNYGVWIWDSYNTRIYHNNFVNNAQHVYTDSICGWDDGYPAGGNYWSDYTGIDLFWGPHQNMTGSDGIGDGPYVIDGSNSDNYPLMSPYEYWSNPITGDINKDMKVDYEDLIQLAASYGSAQEKPNWNPNCDLNKDYKIAVLDLFNLSRNYGKANPSLEGESMNARHAWAFIFAVFAAGMMVPKFRMKKARISSGRQSVVSTSSAHPSETSPTTTLPHQSKSQ